MIEILILCFVFYVGYNVGIAVLTYKLRHIVLREARNQGLNVDDSFIIKDDIEANKITVYQLFIERVNDILYLYEREKNTFICQGTTVDELAETASKLNIKYAAVLDGEQVHAFVDGKIKAVL